MMNQRIICKSWFEDFDEIVKSFASMIYGHRSHNYDKVVKCVEDIEKNG